MAFYDKIIKKITDGFSGALAPLHTIIQNQEIIIIQNKKTLELLDAIHTKLPSSPETPTEK